jgi:hypothetical protein
MLTIPQMSEAIVELQKTVASLLDKINSLLGRVNILDKVVADNDVRLAEAETMLEAMYWHNAFGRGIEKKSVLTVIKNVLSDEYKITTVDWQDYAIVRNKRGHPFKRDAAGELWVTKMLLTANWFIILCRDIVDMSEAEGNASFSWIVRKNYCEAGNRLEEMRKNPNSKPCREDHALLMKYRKAVRAGIQKAKEDGTWLETIGFQVR